MAPVPRAILDDSYADDLKCAICGHTSLQVVHVDALPDYVSCGQCNSAFVAEEGGQRVMYGMIDPSYPETRSFALRQWVHLGEVETKAASEHPPTVPVEPSISPFSEEVLVPEPPSSEEIPAPDEFAPPEDDFPPPDEPLDLEPEAIEEERSPTLKLEYSAIEKPVEAPVTPAFWESQEPTSPEPDVTIDEQVLEEETPFTPRESDPPPGHRFRVVLQGSEANIPESICAHCSQTPVRGRLAVVSSLPQGREVGQRKATTFNLPLCADCHRRAAERSEAERNARLQAHLISALIALISMVAALALGLKPLEEGPLGILILVILAVLGYTLPVIVLLNRIGSFPISEDAAYVRSTLLIPSEVQGLETAFEWRNETFAERFHQVNHEITVGQIVKVKDRSQSSQN
ncbi:MAG: hypothetical protein AMJ88_04000 [Anaerolineae bacterium SM23_ 63]|nr:MAG: hypothetical protein AMJ88_04000 [Anaerolineae bacterium SM23_ 63]HEY48135.1 hypothetical protein [Anaerolineae bacterium]